MRAIPFRRRLTFIALLLCSLFAGCTGIFLQPDRITHYPERSFGTPVEDRWITSADGTKLHALFMPTSTTPKATILYLHGNAENLTTHAHLVSWLPPQGYQVLALDYRGYGTSEGIQTIDDVHQDAEAALAWLVAQPREKTGPIIVYGQSLGGSIATYLVARSLLRSKVSALIIDSAFSSYRRIAREKLSLFWLTWPFQWPFSFLVSDQYAAEDQIARISPIPLLIMHGDMDGIVDVSHAQRLYAAAREPKQLWIVAGGQHINATFHPDIRLRFLDFLQKSVSQPVTPPTP
ncbi:alpha/beta hydrolase [Stenotrophobium rhamnosiphilum]|uniref:Alpha/beta hydrolase n=1 Tax=Stenotrophobium rhamnosiphilum TaxID=2029166 RepID=A0A2T5MFH7_9GAMM|nr:alpha/beta fold hydrolase [Stenotrophobium rhamnosiphilum]PTU31343.1 alpha/beta hydrolase [Stenotrophobium rhamnosiphilum]